MKRKIIKFNKINLAMGEAKQSSNKIDTKVNFYNVHYNYHKRSQSDENFTRKLKLEELCLLKRLTNPDKINTIITG